jgi:hypothetical protein
MKVLYFHFIIFQKFSYNTYIKKIPSSNLTLNVEILACVLCRTLLPNPPPCPQTLYLKDVKLKVLKIPISFLQVSSGTEYSGKAKCGGINTCKISD